MSRKKGYLRTKVEKNRIKLTLAMIVAGVLTLVLVYAFYLYQNSMFSKQEDQGEQFLTEIVAQSCKSVQKQVEGDIQTLNALSATMSEEPKDSESLKSMLTGILERTHFIYAGYSEDGVTACAAGRDGFFEESADMSDFPVLARALEGETCISDSIHDIRGTASVYLYAVPVYENGLVTGALYGVHDASVLTNILESGAEYENVLCIVKPDYTVVSSSGSIKSGSGTAIISIADMKEKLSASGDFANQRAGTCKVQLAGSGEYWVGWQPLGISDWSVVKIVKASTVSAHFAKANSLSWLGYAAIFIVMLCMIALIYAINGSSVRNMERMAYYDPITGGYNANKFSEVAVKLLRVKSVTYAMVAMDVKNSKLMNELYGHGEGDRLFCHIINVLRGELNPENEVFCREFADKFILLMVYTERRQIIQRLKKISEGVRTFDFSDAQRHDISLYFGIKVVRDSGAPTLDGKIARARLACDHAKQDSNSQYTFYEDSLLAQETHRGIIESCMQQSLENDDFVMYLQPKVDLVNGKPNCAEALVRWNHPKLGFLQPGSFIEIFEHNGFITKLDVYMLKRACATIRSWMDRGITPVPIAVNQSRFILYRKDYADMIQELLNDYDIAPNYLVIEITESVAMSDLDVLRSVVEKLRRINVIVSMDDFGSGYSSLNMLKDIRIGELKLDRLFLIKTEDMDRQYTIIKSIVYLARELGIPTVAEGVELKSQAEFLKLIGCDSAQGFLFARPMPVDDFESYIESSKRE